METQRKGVLNEIGPHRGAFSITFLGLFSVLYVFLAISGATPNPPTTSADSGAGSAISQTQTDTPPVPNGPGEYPVRVVISNIKVNAVVANPNTTDVEALDKTLLKGAARYPTSALLGVDGTVVLFGHSSYLPIVRNQAYKTFDGIQNLKQGDIISVYSATTEYRYSVTTVNLKSSTDGVIPLTATGKHLTLVTCDSFGQKTDRFVTTADFVGSSPLQ